MNITKEKKLPKNITISPELNGKYDNEPYFKDKLDRANKFLKKHGIPDEVRQHLENKK